MRAQLVRKHVTNEQYEKEFKNEDNIKLLYSFRKRFQAIDEEDFRSCAMSALFRTLQYHDSNGQKFTSSLYNFMKWECSSFIRKQSRNLRSNLITLVADTNEVKDKNGDQDITNDVNDYIQMVKSEITGNDRLVFDKYLEGKSYTEIANSMGYSSSNIRRILSKIKKRATDLVYSK